MVGCAGSKDRSELNVYSVKEKKIEKFLIIVYYWNRKKSDSIVLWIFFLIFFDEKEKQYRREFNGYLKMCYYYSLLKWGKHKNPKENIYLRFMNIEEKENKIFLFFISP